MIYEKGLSRATWALLSLWSRSIKVRFVNRDIPDRLFAERRNAIYVFWHGSLFLLPYTYRDSGSVIMVSESRDGEIMARMLKHFGFEVVRGSSKRKGHRALIALIHNMRKGKSVATAVDGPRGPLHKVKKGTVFLAGRLQVPIVPVAIGVKRYWVIEKTWDKLIVPAPFTEGVVHYGEPIMVNGTSKEEIESKRRDLEIVLCRLTREAEEDAAAPGEEVPVIRKRPPLFSESSAKSSSIGR